MTRSLGLVSLLRLACGVALLVGCTKVERSGIDETHTVPSSKPIAKPLPLPVPSQTVPAEPRCRAITISGDVEADHHKLMQNSDVSGERWLEIKEGARLVVKHAGNGREYSFTGPARVVPCRRGEEQVLIDHGTFESASGPGARPGAELLLATPLGSVRYADATTRIVVEPTKVKIDLSTGSAAVLPATDARRTGPETVRGPKGTATLSASRAPRPEVLVEACSRAAEVAEQGARAVLDRGPSDAGTLGQRAAAQARARAQARMACAVAFAAAGLVEIAADRQAMTRRLRELESRWLAVPGPARPPGRSGPETPGPGDSGGKK
jgi:hypothetical protein